jgi:hypothetical protein
MAEEKKPKIDLKARLGKAQAATQVPVVPGSRPSTGGVGPGGSVPPPPGGFAPGAGGKPATDPFGAPVQPTPMQSQPPPAATTIKIEMDDEVVRAHTKGGRRVAMAASVTLLFGLGVGFVWGSQKASGDQIKIAKDGAGALAGDVEKSQAKIREFSDKIGAAIKDLKDKKFPDSFSSDLGGLSIPFGAEKLEGRGTGKFNGRCQKLLFSYTQDVEALNDRKDALKNLFAGQKKAITDALASGQNPKVTWAVFAQKSPAHGPLAILAPIAPKDVYAYDAAWPGKFQIMASGQAVDTARYDKGDVFSTESKVITFPLDPSSVASAFPDTVLAKIQSELLKTNEVLNGRAGIPGGEDETSGVIKNGDTLLVELRKIVNAK